MNLVLLMFLIFALTMLTFGTLIIVYETKLPSFLSRSFRYGKFAYKGEVSGIAAKIHLEMPKSWFRHFYIVAVFVYTLVLVETTTVYVFNKAPSRWMTNFLNTVGGTERVARVPTTKVYIALCLMTLQVYRRMYDTCFISVFGKNVTMNSLHYLFGMLHYPGTALAIICEAPGYVNKSTYSEILLNTQHISFGDIFMVLVFMWAWWHQHKTTVILANLRKNKEGVVVSSEHKLPYGDWFNYLSAPHQSAEILMYSSVTLLLWNNTTWLSVFIWVLINQIQTILLSHWWYQDNFKGFPKNRRALIPFLY